MRIQRDRLKPVLLTLCVFSGTGFSREEADVYAIHFAAWLPTPSRLKPVPQKTALLRAVLSLQTKISLSHELSQRPTQAWGFPCLKVFGQRRLVAQLADRHCCVHRISLWNL